MSLTSQISAQVQKEVTFTFNVSTSSQGSVCVAVIENGKWVCESGSTGATGRSTRSKGDWAILLDTSASESDSSESRNLAPVYIGVGVGVIVLILAAGCNERK